jgi:hypothetical protein
VLAGAVAEGVAAVSEPAVDWLPGDWLPGDWLAEDWPEAAGLDWAPDAQPVKTMADNAAAMAIEGPYFSVEITSRSLRSGVTTPFKTV